MCASPSSHRYTHTHSHAAFHFIVTLLYCHTKPTLCAVGCAPVHSLNRVQIQPRFNHIQGSGNCAHRNTHTHARVLRKPFTNTHRGTLDSVRIACTNNKAKMCQYTGIQSALMKDEWPGGLFTVPWMTLDGQTHGARLHTHKHTHSVCVGVISKLHHKARSRDSSTHTQHTHTPPRLR